MEFSSKRLNDAVREISQLPGIGKRSALRLALHLLKQPESQVEQLAEALTSLRKEVIFCEKCHNLSDVPLCEICANPNRDRSKLCVVEDIRDVLALENTAQYKGLYHILGGVISPIDGIGPQDLNIRDLADRIVNDSVEEVIFALSATLEADTTTFYLSKILAATEVKISTLARGIPVGDQLEYTDEVTLGRSILARVPYKQSSSMD
ncbi:MAG: recombination mediator RecR [Flavobacteriaceae bacterium]